MLDVAVNYEACLFLPQMNLSVRLQVYMSDSLFLSPAPDVEPEPEQTIFTIS